MSALPSVGQRDNEVVARPPSLPGAAGESSAAADRRQPLGPRPRPPARPTPSIRFDPIEASPPPRPSSLLVLNDNSGERDRLRGEEEDSDDDDEGPRRVTLFRPAVPEHIITPTPRSRPRPEEQLFQNVQFQTRFRETEDGGAQREFSLVDGRPRPSLAISTALPILPVRSSTAIPIDAPTTPRPPPPRREHSGPSRERQRLLSQSARQRRPVGTTTTSRPVSVSADGEYEYYYEYYYDYEDDDDVDVNPKQQQSLSSRTKPLKSIGDYDLNPLVNKVSKMGYWLLGVLSI